jgi:hypothetical protein
MRARFIIFHIFEPIKKRRKDTWAANKGESRQQETSKNSKPKRRRFLVLVEGDFGASHLSQCDWRRRARIDMWRTGAEVLVLAGSLAEGQTLRLWRPQMWSPKPNHRHTLAIHWLYHGLVDLSLEPS